VTIVLAVLLSACAPSGTVAETVLRDTALPRGAHSSLAAKSPQPELGRPDLGPMAPIRSGLDPRSLTVRIEAVTVGTPVRGSTSRLEPSLVPARDALVARLQATLAEHWVRATRGLGALTVTTADPVDLVIAVLPGRGSSFHVIGADGSRSVGLFVVGDLGDSPEYFDLSALHELGHAWCCSGPDAGADGHWREALEDPGLAGTDRFGLMTHPVTCLVRSGLVVRCPRVFSARELTAMGFVAIPAAAADPCIVDSDALKAQLASLDAALVAPRQQIEDARVAFARVAEQVQAIEARYPSGGMPAEVRVSYAALLERYDALSDAADAKIDAVNAVIVARNAVVSQLAALRC